MALYEAVSRLVFSVRLVTRKLTHTLVLAALIPLSHQVAVADSSYSGQVDGVVIDQAGARVGGASIVLLGAAGLEAQRSITDQNGRFTLERVLAADYIVSVQKTGFREVRRVLHVTPGETLQLRFQLQVASILETVTITPTRGQPQEISQVVQAQEVLTSEEIAHRYANILPQVLRDVPGVHIQQTTAGQKWQRIKRL